MEPTRNEQEDKLLADLGLREQGTAMEPARGVRDDLGVVVELILAHQAAMELPRSGGINYINHGVSQHLN